MEPVEVGGVTVTRATLHNEEDINRKQIREGDMVIVQRAGDVIPQIVGPAGGKHQPGTKEFRMPTHCPLCGVEVVKPEGEVRHRCPNNACPSRGLETLISWTGMADIDGVGEQTIRHPLGEGPRPFAPRSLSADQGAAARARGFRRDLRNRGDRVDPALEGRAVLTRPARPEHPGIGWVLAQNLARHFGDVDRLMAARQEEVEAVEGYRARPRGDRRRMVRGRPEPRTRPGAARPRPALRDRG